MKHANLMIFGRIFSRNVLNEFINHSNPKPYLVSIKRASINPDNMKNGEIISEIYKYMAVNYRNEYIYKNTLLNELLIKKHNIENTTALAEIPIGRSKADFILINGKAEVYEIKTELDNFDKLETQLHNYYKAFDHVNVVTSSGKCNLLKSLLSGSNVGIYVLNENMELKEIKRAKREGSFLEHKAIFKILRKKEYERIIMNKFGKLPNVSQFDYYKECFIKFQEISIKEIYKCFLQELKKRCYIEKEYFTSLPLEIKSLVYFSNLKKTDVDELSAFLTSSHNNGGSSVLSVS